MARLSEAALRRLDEAREGLDCTRFAVPQAAGSGLAEAQMSLF